MPLEPQNYYLTVLTPVADDADSKLRHLEALEQRLEELRAKPASPLEDCEMVHMARFVIIDELPLQLGNTRREFLMRNYLLFIAELSGDRDDFLDALYERANAFVHSIWGHCAGFPHALGAARDGENGPARAQYRSVYFRRYMQRHEVKTRIPFSGTPNVSVAEIRNAIDTQATIARFIKEHPPYTTTAADLHRDWLGTR